MRPEELMTNEDLKIKEKYLSFDESERNRYLDENKLVIMDIRPTDEGVEYDIVFCENYYDAMLKEKKEGETENECVSRVLTSAIKQMIEIHKEEKKDGDT